MVSRLGRLQFTVGVLALVGIGALWLGATGWTPSLLLVGAAIVGGAGYAIASGYTGTSLTVLFGGLAGTAVARSVVLLRSDGLATRALLFFVVGLLGGLRALQYWRARPWTPAMWESK